MEPKDDLARSHRPAVIIAAAMMAGVAVYVAVALLLKASRPVPKPLLPAKTISVLRLCFYGFSIVQVILIRVMRGRLFRGPAGVPAGSAGRRLMTMSLLTSFLSEVPALLGFVLFLLTGQTRDLYPLVLVSLVLMFMFFPRLRDWEAWAATDPGSGSCGPGPCGPRP